MKNKIILIVLLLNCSIVFGQAKDRLHSTKPDTTITESKPDSTEFKFWVAEWQESLKMLRQADSIAIYNKGYYEAIRNERFMRAKNAEIKLKGQKEIKKEGH